MNKFIKNISNDATNIKMRRATLIELAVKNQAITKVNKLNDEMNKVRLKIEDLTDLAATNVNDLTVGGPNFNATLWIDKLNNHKLELYSLEIKLSVAQNIYNEWFTETELQTKNGETLTEKG